MLNRNPKYVTAKLSQAFVVLALAVLGLRVIFSLFNADLTNGVVRWVYETSVPLMQPFRGLFSVEVHSTNHVLELPVVFAMAAYALLGAVIVAVLVKLPDTKKSKK